MDTLLEFIKIGIPAIVAIIGGVISVWQLLRNSKLNRSQKIDEILAQGVNIAEQLGNLGKIASGTKLDYVLNYAKNKIELTVDEIEKAKNFIEQTFVGFFASPATTTTATKAVVASAENTTELPTNEPINTIPNVEQIGDYKSVETTEIPVGSEPEPIAQPKIQPTIESVQPAVDTTLAPTNDTETPTVAPTEQTYCSGTNTETSPNAGVI